MNPQLSAGPDVRSVSASSAALFLIRVHCDVLVSRGGGMAVAETPPETSDVECPGYHSTASVNHLSNFTLQFHNSVRRIPPTYLHATFHPRTNFPPLFIPHIPPLERTRTPAKSQQTHLTPPLLTTGSPPYRREPPRLWVATSIPPISRQVPISSHPGIALFINFQFTH